ncbi:MAG: hypothetical protein NVS9B12_15020 [Vulcanimicrobiaceae bacterium]
MISEQAGPEVIAFADTLPIMVMMSDPHGTVTFFNRRWHEYTGQPPFRKDAGEGWRAYIHPDDLPAVASQWGTAVQRGCAVEMKYRLLNGATRAFHWFAARAVPLRDASGTIYQWIGTAMEIEDPQTALQIEDVYALQERVADAFTFRASHPQGRHDRQALSRITVTLPEGLASRINAFRDSFRLSVSSIVEHAVAAYLERGHADELIEDLRARGASRRRR